MEKLKKKSRNLTEVISEAVIVINDNDGASIHVVGDLNNGLQRAPTNRKAMAFVVEGELHRRRWLSGELLGS